MTYHPLVQDVKAYAEEHGVKLSNALKAIRKTHVHTPKPSTFRFRLCGKCGATATHQRYCAECGAVYCDECQKHKLTPQKASAK